MTNSLFDKKKGWKEGPTYWSDRSMILEPALRQPVIGCNQRLQYFGTARLKRDGICWSNVLHIYGYDTPQVLAALVATYGSDITPLTGAPAASHYLQRWLRGRWHYTPEHFILRGLKQKTKDFCQLRLQLKCQTFQFRKRYVVNLLNSTS